MFIFHHLRVVLFRDYAKITQVYANMSADFYIDLVSEVYGRLYNLYEVFGRNVTYVTWDSGFRLNNLCFYIISVLAGVSELHLSKVHTTPVV